MNDGIRSKNVPQSYFDNMYSSVNDSQEEYDLGLWLDENEEIIMG